MWDSELAQCACSPRMPPHVLFVGVALRATPGAYGASACKMMHDSLSVSRTRATPTW